MLFVGLLASLMAPMSAAGLSSRASVQTCAAPSGRVQRLDRTLLIDGHIDKGLYDCFRKLFDDDVRRVEVRSAGGDPHFAMPIAEELSRVRPVISIKDFCGSACASLILPTASKIESDGPSIVMFHNTSTSSFEETGRDYDDHGDLENLSRRETALYKRLGIDQWLLTGPFLALNPVCSIPGVGGLPSSFRSHWKAVVLERPLLDRLQFKLPETVVDTPERFMKYVASFPDHGSALLKGGIRFLSYAPGSGNSPQPLAAPNVPVLPPCDQSEARGGDRPIPSASHRLN